MTDENYKILSLLRVVNTDEVKMVVGETYQISKALQDFQQVDVDNLRQVLRNAGPKDNLKKVLNVAYGKNTLLAYGFIYWHALYRIWPGYDRAYYSISES